MPDLTLPRGAVYGIPNPPRSRYGAVIAATPGLTDLWPMDDALGASALRNIVTPARTLSALTDVNMGAPSLLANDPNGRCMTGGRARTGSNWSWAGYSAGTIEFLCRPVKMGNSAVGNWLTNGAMVYFTGNTVFRAYINSTVQADSTYSVGVVSHFCETWDGTTMRLYLNGVQVIAPAIGSPSTVAAPFEVGSYSNTASTEGFAQFQHVAVYNRALPAHEVMMHASLMIRPS